MELTKKELANIAGYTYRRLYDIDRDLPENRKLFVQGKDSSKYDLSLFVQRWVQYNIETHQDETVYDLDEVKAKHEAIKAEKTQLEVDRMRGQLIDLQDVKRLWGDIANTVQQNMMHLPSKLAPMLLMQDNPEIIADIISDEIRKILEIIADTPLPDYAQEDDDSEEKGDEEDEEA